MASIIDPATKIIFCEGQPNSLDSIFLSNILAPSTALIRPVGGKNGMKAFIDGYLSGYPVDKQPEYIGFRDRDFDAEPPEKEQLIELSGAKPIWLTHLACIENYLIDSALIWQYWHERETVASWHHGKAPSIDLIEEHILTTVKELCEYEAVRWGLSKLKPGSRWPEIQTTWTAKGSGDLPASLKYKDCLANASQLVEAFKSQTEGVSSEKLLAYADAYRAKFSQDSFVSAKQYRFWFHGKDFLVQLCKRFGNGFPRASYLAWAVAHIDSSKYPDLQQLTRIFS